jgi:hypothetical protein
VVGCAPPPKSVPVGRPTLALARWMRKRKAIARCCMQSPFFWRNAVRKAVLLDHVREMDLDCFFACRAGLSTTKVFFLAPKNWGPCTGVQVARHVRTTIFSKNGGIL